jgi:hypothetical protein
LEELNTSGDDNRIPVRPDGVFADQSISRAKPTWRALAENGVPDPNLAQCVFPVGAVSGAAKHAGETTLLAGIVTADAGEHIGWGHGKLLQAKILRPSYFAT